jgi:hypothetical protein
MTTTFASDLSVQSDLAIAADATLTDTERQAAIDRLVAGPLRYPVPHARWHAHRHAIAERYTSLWEQTGLCCHEVEPFLIAEAVRWVLSDIAEGRYTPPPDHESDPTPSFERWFTNRVGDRLMGFLVPDWRDDENERRRKVRPNLVSLELLAEQQEPLVDSRVAVEDEAVTSVYASQILSLLNTEHVKLGHLLADGWRPSELADSFGMTEAAAFKRVQRLHLSAKEAKCLVDAA